MTFSDPFGGSILWTPLPRGAPDAFVYENQSGGIVATLEGLLEKAESQMDDARKKETANLNNFDMLKQSLEDEIKLRRRTLQSSNAFDTCRTLWGDSQGGEPGVVRFSELFR